MQKQLAIELGTSGLTLFTRASKVGERKNAAGWTRSERKMGEKEKEYE